MSNVAASEDSEGHLPFGYNIGFSPCLEPFVKPGFCGKLLSKHTALASLMSSEEALAMVEKMLDASEELLLDTPYLRRIREQGREEGWVEGVAKGKEEGLVEGKIQGLREAILEAITLRFNPLAAEYRQISQQLEAITSRQVLQQLHAAAIQSEEMATFVARLREE